MLAAALPLSGCATWFSGYEVAPNGLPVEEAAIRRQLAAEPASVYDEIVTGETELPDDDLLRLLYAGTAGRYSGHYRESGQFLDLASYVADDRVTISVSRQTASFITSDRALAYVPQRTERLMISYIAALSFLEADDLGGAVVEARRIEALLDRFNDGADTARTRYDSRFFHYFAGTIFEAAGEANSAAVAYRRAGASGEARVSDLYSDVPADSMGEIVLLLERGFVPHRVEQSVAVVLPGQQARMLTEGGIGEKAAAAAAAAARILTYASHAYGDRGPYYTDRSYQRGLRVAPWRDGCGGFGEPSCRDDDGEPYILRISWPVLYQEETPDRTVPIRVDGTPMGATWHLDVGNGIRRDFADRLGTILARTVFRAATKIALSEVAEEVVSEQDETAGKIVGVLVNLGTLLAERADTRSWHLLPGVVDLVRIPIPAGTHSLTVGGEGLLSRAVNLGPVAVRPGETTFVAHRIWR